MRRGKGGNPRRGRTAKREKSVVPFEKGRKEMNRNTNPPILYDTEQESSNSEHGQKGDKVGCPRCKAIVPDAPFCCQCGRALHRRQNPKRRGNGQGTVVRRGDKWRAVVTLGYYMDDSGKVHRKTRSQSFGRKTDAVSALATLRTAKTAQPSITLRELYDRWEPTHNAGASTMTCYRSAFRYFEPLWFLDIRDIALDDLQECIDECGKGRRTRENMRAVVGLLYKYAIPRQFADRNLAEYLKINAEAGKHLEGFTVDEVNLIRDSVGIVDGADVILCMIYTGFRPSEFLSLKGADYDPERQTLTGGAKTKAGKNRIVTISPKIAHLIPHKPPAAFLWDVPHDPNNFIDRFFYPTLERIGIDNPMIDGRHRLTPHSCRHTFATLMKRVPGADRDKMELIGHASAEMLRYYQDVGIDDLRKITDQI